MAQVNTDFLVPCTLASEKKHEFVPCCLSPDRSDFSTTNNGSDPNSTEVKINLVPT